MVLTTTLPVASVKVSKLCSHICYQTNFQTFKLFIKEFIKETKILESKCFLCPGIGGIPYGDENEQITLTTCRFVFLKNKTYENTVLRFYLVVS